MSLPAISFQDTYQITEITGHPLKNTPFVGIPRHVANMPMSANAFRLLSHVCSEWGSDGHIEFTLSTLCVKIQKSVRTVERTLKEVVKLGLIRIEQTGRSLIFKLTDLMYSNQKCQIRVAKNGNSLPIDSKTEKTTTEPDPPPKPAQSHVTPAEKKALFRADDDIQNFRKNLPTEISFRLSNATIEPLLGISSTHVQYAAQRAMEPTVKNKTGFFLKLVKDDPPMSETDQQLKPARIPIDIDANSDQMKIIVCYNRNITGYGCSVMRLTGQPTENCKRFCPFVKNRGGGFSNV